MKRGLKVVTTLVVAGLLARGTVIWQSQARAKGGEAALPEVKAILASAPRVPPPVDRVGNARVIVQLETTEAKGTLADGVQYTFWTFGGTVPGPFIRVRVGDVVQIRLKNGATSLHPHSIDLHAVGEGALHLGGLERHDDPRVSGSVHRRRHLRGRGKDCLDLRQCHIAPLRSGLALPDHGASREKTNNSHRRHQRQSSFHCSALLLRSPPTRQPGSQRRPLRDEPSVRRIMVAGV